MRSIQKKYKTMGKIINEHIFQKPLLPLQALVAPATFDPKAQNVNIHEKFSYYENTDKAYAYTFSDSYNTLTLSAASGVSYRYGYTRGGVDYVFDVASVTNPFTASIDTKRWVIVNNSYASITVTWPMGSVWGYMGAKCYSSSSTNNNTHLKYIHYQSTITTLGSHIGCTGFNGSLTIPNSVTSIGDAAFMDCTGILNITLQNSITYIGAYAFRQCSNAVFNDNNLVLTNVSSLGYGAFFNCTKLKSIDISACNISTLSYFMFYGCSQMNSCILPANMTVFANTGQTGYGIFSGCSSLSNIVIPSSVTTIGSYAFYNCTGFNGSLTIPNSVTSIGDAAFMDCTGILNITLQNSITYIGAYAFRQCSNAVFNDNNLVLTNVSSLGYGAFFNCTKLKSIDISACNISTLSYFMFYGCSQMNSCILPTNMTAFANTGQEGYGIFSGCSSLSNIVIPSSVTTIGSYAFYNCTGLTSITIPSSVTTIGNLAFWGCTNISSYLIHANTAPAAAGAFGNYASVLHIPITNSGYNVAPWTTTTIFSSIIADL